MKGALHIVQQICNFFFFCEYVHIWAQIMLSWMLGKEKHNIVENKESMENSTEIDTKAMHASTYTVSGSLCIINALCSNGSEEGLL